MYAELSVCFLADVEDSIEAYEKKGRAMASSTPTADEVKSSTDAY